MTAVSTHRAAVQPQGQWRRHRRRFLLCFALVLPVVAIRLFTAGWPILKTAVTSFQHSNPTEGAATWAGLANYRALLESTTIQQSVLFTVIFAVVSTILELALGVGLAVLLNRKFRFRRIVRAINLIPWAIPAVVAGVAFQFALDPNYGTIAGVLNHLGFDHTLWLSETNPARAAIIGVNVWRNAGFVAVLLLAGLQTIPDELYEASAVDGASPFMQFRRITLPLITPVMASAGTFMLIWQVSSFDLVLSMTGGGPGTATEVLGHVSYIRGFQNFDFGFSAAVAMVLLVVVGVIGVIGSMARRRAEF
jgi:multiple sugar transport system permease protein